MKVIDLLNKIANGEEVPLVLKYNNKIYEYTKEIDWYLREDLKSELFIDKSRLNDEVEIIEEEKEIPEKLTPLFINDILDIIGTKYTKSQDKALQNLFEHVRNQDKKINEIIDYLYYLINKGDE